MANIVDERGYNQIFKPTTASALRLRRRAEAMTRAMHLPDSPVARKDIHILEIGCGMGSLANELALLTGARVTGVDLSEKFVAHATATYRQPLLDFTVRDLSQSKPSGREEQYDYIVGNGILHHLYHHLDSFFPVLGRWLKPGGGLIFWEPNLYNPYIYLIFSFALFRRMARLEPDEMAFSASFISAKLARAGFVRPQVQPRDFLLPNTPASIVPLSVVVSDRLEGWPLVKWWSQSLFISSKKPDP